LNVEHLPIVALSKSKKYLAFSDSQPAGKPETEWHDKLRWFINVYDLDNQNIINQVSMVYESSDEDDNPFIMWDPNEESILYFTYNACIGSWQDWQRFTARWDIRQKEFQSISSLPLQLRYDLGLLGVTFGPQEGYFLTEPGLIVFQALGYLYILDAPQKNCPYKPKDLTLFFRNISSICNFTLTSLA